MRLKIELSGGKIVLPVNYQSILQGFIYSMFDKREYGLFLHEEGYRLNEKTFKLFVFSNLFGKFSIEDQKIIFSNKVCFYISSQEDKFIQYIYGFLMNNHKVVLGHNILDIDSIEFVKTPYFKGEKDIKIRTLSPLVAYTTIGKKVLYYKPSDKEFESYCKDNLMEKEIAYGRSDCSIIFEIKDVIKEKKRIVHFKNTFYISYTTELLIHTNYETLSYLYDTGLSSKGSAGFGMIVVDV